MQLWDLREAASVHPSAQIDDEIVALRSPTYCSDAAQGGHSTPIRDICALPSHAESDDLSVASLEMEGTLIIWLILETDSAQPDMLDFGQVGVGGWEAWVGGRLGGW